MEPTDLSPYKVVGQITDKDTNEVLAEFSSPALKEDGKIKFSLGIDDILPLPVAKNVWGLTLISKDGSGTDTTTIVVGDVSVRQAVYAPSSG